MDETTTPESVPPVPPVADGAKVTSIGQHPPRKRFSATFWLLLMLIFVVFFVATTAGIGPFGGY